MGLLQVLTVFCLLAVSGVLAAAEPVRPVMDYQTAEPNVTVTDILSRPATSWQTLADTPSFGYTDATYWFRFELEAAAYDRVLHLSYPLLDQVDVHFIRAGRVLRSVRVGDRLAFAERPVQHKDFVISVPSASVPSASNAEPMLVLLKVQSSSSMRVPVAVWDHASFLETQVTGNKAAGLYFGVVICMAVYNLFGFFVSRERSFLTYSAYTVNIGLLMAALDGSGYRYLWPEWVWLQDKAIPLFASLGFIAAALFTSQLLQLKAHNKKLEWALLIFASLFGVVFIANLILPYAVTIKLLLPMAISGCAFLLGTGVYLWRRGHQYARIFTIAWVTLLVSVIANSLGYLGFIDGVFIQRYAIMIGSGTEILLLSLVLAIRYGEERREKPKAQAEALARAEDAQLAQQELNEQLEEKVSERTFELEIALRELREVNEALERKTSEDGLTGIFNRRHLNRQLETEFRRCYRQQGQLALLMLDIDYFKPVNDTHGHLVGDQILIELAGLLKRKLKRAGDTLCRYGGEEFAVLLPNTDTEGASQIAEKLQQAVRNHQFSTDAGLLEITISIGVAHAEAGDYQVAEQLLAAADKALYEAKQAGRNQFCIAPAASEAPAASHINA